MALTKVGKEGVTGISNSSNATAITIDSSENVGIGNASPASQLDLGGGATNSSRLRLNRGTDDANQFMTVGYDNISVHRANVALASTQTNMKFQQVGSDGTRIAMQIDGSGDWSVSKVGFHDDGRNSNASNNASMFYAGTFLSIASQAETALLLNRMGNNGSVATFRQAGNDVGTISVTGSNTAYNTSSDYRLKENVDYTWDATTRLKQLKPARFNFIADPDTTVDGFLAHEAQTVCPESVTGTKDAVDADGNPIMQGIDQAKLVPLLCKTILELEARITALETA